MTTYFTSDTHFSHENVIKYCNRPFATVSEMNIALIKNWNDRVKPEDTVYHLGDVAMGPKEALPGIIQALNGHKILIRGNHDRGKAVMVQAGFEAVHWRLWLPLSSTGSSARPESGSEPQTGSDIVLYLQHIPAQDFPGADYHLHGHVHCEYARKGRALNVGVDVRGFRPVTLEELLSE